MAEADPIRLYMPASLGAGETVALDAGQVHYLRNVMRRRPGDPVAAFNGRDGEWAARIETLDRKAGSLAVEALRRAPVAGPDLWLLFAPVKRLRLDYLVAKATELGVSALWPVFTARTQPDRVKAERLRANIVEAAEQCARLDLPDLFDAAPLDAVLADWPPARRLLVCDETGGTPIQAALSRAAVEGPAGPWAVLVGPEGGFAPSELDGLGKLPFVIRAGLGPRLLRADTAALAAVACWQAVLGDGDRAPRAG